MNNSHLILKLTSFWKKFLLFSIFLSITSPNPLLTFASLITLPIVLNMVWRPNEPPIFAFILFFHWLQTTVKVFHADIKYVPINEISGSESIDLAIYFSLFGILAIAKGVSFSLRKIPIVTKNELIMNISKYSVKKTFLIYVIFVYISGVLVKLSQSTPSIAGIVYNLASIKWMFLYFLFILLIYNKRISLLIVLLIIETLIGFSGFFSSFKEVYIIFFLSYFTLQQEISLKKILYIFPIIMMVFILMIVWTGIKQDYRSVVTGGNQIQTVEISTDKQIDLYINLISHLNSDKLVFALEKFAYRLEYIEFFAETINYVPKIIDHEYGLLWFNAYTNFLTPRILFPKKEVLDDSIRTSKYTGRTLMNGSQGVSISLGYFAESYVDFGFVLMWLPLLMLGLIYGYIHRYFLSSKIGYVYSYSVSIFIISNYYLLEKRNDKIIGGIIISLILIFLLQKFIKLVFRYTEKVERI